MEITLYTNLSEPNRLNKVLQNATTLTGELRSDVNLISPSIRVYGNNTVLGNNINYVYIPDFKRYYFINDIVCVRNNIFDISCNVDVLMTYKEQLKKLPVVVERQEKVFNLYLQDNAFKALNKEHWITQPIGTLSNPRTIIVVSGGVADG